MINRRAALLSAVSSALLLSRDAAARTAKAGCATPSPKQTYTYELGGVIVVSGTSDAEITITVDKVPTQPFVEYFIAYSGYGRFSFVLTEPDGVFTPLMTAINPDVANPQLGIRLPGANKIAVTADAQWAAIIYSFAN